MHAFLLVMLHRHLSRDLTVLTPMSHRVVHSNGIWKADQTVPNAFPGKHFSTILSPNKVLTPFEKCFPGKRIRNGFSAFQNLRLGGVYLATNGEQSFYAPQTKMLEGGTKDDVWIFD
jgi:hypothetical protein